MNISKQPDPLVLTGNEVPLHVTGSNMYVSLGRKAWALLSFVTGQTVAAESYITLAWGVLSLTITFKASPAAGGWEFRSGTVNAQWISDFTELLRSHYELERDFNIQPGAQIYARTNSAAFTIGVVTTVASAALTVHTRTGIDPVIREGYQLVCQVRTFPGNATIGEDAITPGSNQKAEFDVSDYLNVNLELAREGLQNFTYPAQVQKIKTHAAHTMQFYLRYAEKWENQVQRMFTTLPCSAILGGLSRRKHWEFAAGNKTFYSHLTANNQFLTWQPASKVTGLRTPERMYFYNSASRSILLKSTKRYTDGTSSTVTLYTRSCEVGVVEIDCSFANFASGTVKIEQYDIWLESGGVRISETRSFVPDYRYYRNEDHLVFRNSLGGYDTLRCTGRRTSLPEFDRETFEDDNKLMQALENLITSKFELNTGSLDADAAAWLDELFLSREVFWITGGRLITILITGNKKNPTTDDQLRFSFDIEFRFSTIEQFYSMPEIVATSTPQIELT